MAPTVLSNEDPFTDAGRVRDVEETPPRTWAPSRSPMASDAATYRGYNRGVRIAPGA